MKRKKYFKIYCVLGLAIFLFNCSPKGSRIIEAKPQKKPVPAVNETDKWLHVSGNWTIDAEKKLVIENKGWARAAGYSEINNYNTLLTLGRMTSFNRLYADFKIEKSMTTRKKKANVDLLLSLGGNNRMKNFLGIRLSGTDEQINSIELVESKIKNPHLNKYKTWNYSITVLAENKKLSFKNSKFHKIKIFIKKKKLYCYLDGKKVIQHKTSYPLEGYMGISSRNCRLAINDVLLKNNRKIIFHDDFSEDLIKRYRGRYRKK